MAMSAFRVIPAVFLAALLCGATASATPAAGGIGELAFFLGSWQCAGSFPATGKTISSVVRFESDLGGAAIVKHHDDNPPNDYRAIESWNYDASDKRFNAAVADNFGGVRTFVSDGWRDNALTWTIANGAKPIQQFVYTRISDNSMRIDWQLSKDGTSYVVGDTLTCTKR